MIFSDSAEQIFFSCNVVMAKMGNYRPEEGRGEGSGP
jgi:hypothetical protein